MVNTESMESSDSPCHKDRDHKSKSRNSKKEKLLFSNQERGDESTIGKTIKSHRTVPNDRKSEKDKPKVEISLLLLDNKEKKKKRKSDSNKKDVLENENSDNIETSVSLSDKQNSSSRTPKTERVYKIESILKNSNARSEVTKDGVRFDKNVKSSEKENAGFKEKSKTIEKSKKESKDTHQTSKLKSFSRHEGSEEKSNNQLISERCKDGIKVFTEKSKSEYRENDDRSKSKIKTKDKADFKVFESAVEKYLEEGDRSERKKERRERKDNNKIRKADAVEICPEKQKSKKSIRRIEEDSNVASEANRTTKMRDRGDKETHERERKDEHKEKEHKKKKHNSLHESGISDQPNKLENDRFKEPENRPSKKQEKRRNESNLSEVPKSQMQERDQPEKTNGGEISKHKGKSKKSKYKYRTYNNESEKVSEKDKLTQREPSNGIQIGKKAKFECLKDDDNGKSIDKFALKKRVKDSRIDPTNKEIDKEKTTENNVKNDKYIKVFNKEDVLMKGMQDLTVKELYLMENLKDYELKLNEQFLKKIKRKRRDPQSTSDNFNGRSLTEKFTIPPITNLPVCKLPSVKEIFKISNLADYERSYKEMQDRKKKKYNDTREDFDFGFSPSLRRKRLNKFSLESKEENSNIKDKTITSTKSSQWLLKNYRSTAVKNEGGGEHMICNVSLIYVNENVQNSDKEKKLETGDASGPSYAAETNQGFRTASKTSLRDVSNGTKSLEKNANYLKMCQKFHTDIREESKKLLQHLAGNKNVRISIKDTSVQSIKKKPSLSSSEDLCTMKNHNFDYVLLKKPKRDLGDSSSILRKFRTEIKEGLIREPTEKKEEKIEEVPWNLAHSNNIKGYFENNSSVRAFDKNVNKNAGVFIKNECKLDSTSPDNLYNLNTKYESDPLSSGNFTQSSVDYNLSSSSYSLSIFDRNKDLSVPNNIPLRNPGDLDLLKRCDVSREHPEINILRKRDKTKSRIDDSRGAWFQRSSTLERIINEIEEFPEKDTNPSCNVLRESKIGNRLNKTFSEIEKSNNVLLSYINHVNYNSHKRDKNRNNVDRADKNFNDHLMKDKHFIPNRRKYRDSLCCLKDINSFEQSHLNSSLISGDKVVELPCAVSSRSYADMATLNNERSKKARTNVLEASLQSASTTFKCDLKAEERENVINTKLVISDPSKRSNILQIQFCGKLNINFNKDNIELGNIDSIQEPLEIKFTEGQSGGDKKLEISQTNNGSEDLLSLNDCLPGQRFSEECLNKNGSLSSRAQSENCLSNYCSVSNSSRTIVFRGKRDGSLPRGKKSKHLKANKKKHSLMDQMEAAITTEMNTSQIKDKHNVEETEHPDNTESTIQQKSCIQLNIAAKASTTSGERDNLATENNDSSNNRSLEDGKRISSLSATRIEILKESPKLIDLRVLEEKGKTAIEQLTITHSKSEVEPDKEEKSSEESKTVNENYLFVKNTNLNSVTLEKSEAEKTRLNLDACVQTISEAHCDSTVINKLNVFSCDVETCTSSTFELKQSDDSNKRSIVEGSACSFIKKGEKSYSSSTNGTCEDTDRISAVNTCKDVTTSSSEGIAPLNKENTYSLENECSQEINKENNSPSIKLPSPKTTALKSRVIETHESGSISESSHEVASGKRDPLHQSYNPHQNSYPLHIKEVDQENNDKTQHEKKKLLLSQSEEDAFKYLLLKGIGRTDTEDKLSSKSVHEFSDCYPNPKVMFSAIRKRLENFKSKAGDSKLISDRKRANSSKQKKFSAIENRTKTYALERECPNCSVCTCGKLNPVVGYWDIQRSINMSEHLPQGQMVCTEPQISNRSNAPGAIKPVNHKQYREDSVINNLTGPIINDCHSISEYDLADMSDEALYGLQNLSGSVKYSGNPFLNLYPPVKKENEALVGPRVEGQKQISGNVGAKNLGSPQCFKTFYEKDSSSNHYDQKHFIDDGRWTECVQRNYTGESSLNHCNKQNFAENLTCCLPQKHFSSEPTQNKSANFRTSERLSFPIRERQTFSNDTFDHKNPNKKQYKSTKLLPSGDLCHSKDLIESFFYNMENNSNRQENSAQVEDDLNNQSIDNAEEDEEKKKLPRKHKFSKHASKIWKSLFKKNKKYTPEISEYEDIPPEHFIAQRPKITENKLKIKKWLKKISQSKANDFQNVQDKLFKKLNKIMSSEVTMPLQEVFDIIQKPQFHRDNHSYSGRKKFDRVNTCNYLSNDGHYIMITEKLNVRGFLVSIGLKDDVAWEAQDNAELNSRLQTAINEARSWVNKITMSQGLLIYILAVMTPTEVNNYYLQIVEAIINSRISNVGTLLSVMMVLKRYERGKYGIKTVISREHVRDLVPKQVSETEKRHQDNRSRFIYLYNIAKRAAGKVNMRVDKESAGLLARLTASYSPGLRPYLSLLAYYIAQKVISDKGQLAMAVSYLQSLHIKHFDQEIFEKNCGLDQNKVVIKSDALEPLTLSQESDKRQAKKRNEKRPGRSNLTERMQASWVKQRKTKPHKESSEKIKTDNSTLERKPSTMDLLKEQNKSDK